MKTCVVALGKIGLPLAVQIASSGREVIGVDVNATTVDQVNRGEEPFLGEHGLAQRLSDVVGAGALTATTEFDKAIPQSDTIIVVVPVIVDSEARPDFGAIDSATRSIGASLQPGSLVSYETTLPVHTTRQHFVPALEAASGMRAGEDFFVCHSPERVFTGRVFADLRKYPKLVGGVDDESARRAVAFYRSVLQFDERDDLVRPNGVWDLGSAEAAELAKLAETTYRNINIAFANELALHSESLGVDVAEVIEASNSQPFSHIHRPGIAVGGHCIPVYPKFYLSVDSSATLPAAAIELNESMPGRAADFVDGRLGVADKRIAVLGLSYRGGVKEDAFSGTYALVDRLRSLGAHALVHDPLYTDDEIEARDFTPYHLGDPCDAAIVHTDHDDYGNLTAADLPGAQLLYDGRRIVSPSTLAPIEVHVLGRG